MNRKDVETVQRETVYQGWLRVERWHVRHKLFEGGKSGVFTREILSRPGAVGLLPYDPKRDRVCLIEQFRCGIYAGGGNPWAIEMVAGLIDKDEKPEAIARREVEEEAGLKVKRIVSLPGFFDMPGGSTEYFHMFCGEVDLPNTSSKIHGLKEEDENIRTYIISRQEAIAWLDSGKINSGPGQLILNWLARFGEELRKEWLSESP